MNNNEKQVQGMSFLGAMLIMHMEQFEAFVTLSNLLSTHFFTSLYKVDMQQVSSLSPFSLFITLIDDDE